LGFSVSSPRCFRLISSLSAFSSKSCEDEVVSQLVELQRRAADHARRGDPHADDEFFYAEQNARLVKIPRPTTA
jgi:hypothetical protein